MKILILGKGYIGTALYKQLSTCYDVDFISQKEINYTKRSILKEYIERQKECVSLIINTCGYTGRPNVDACESNISDTWYYNVITPVNIQKVCKDLMIPLIHISSGCIYTGYDKEFTEEDEPNFGMMSNVSSWYSKTKHACEMMLVDTPVYIFRIRMPFDESNSDRNILTKLLKYDNIINMKNSLTNIEDLCTFVLYFTTDLLEEEVQYPYGVYNVVNPSPIETQDIITRMKSVGLCNPNWKTISIDELHEKTLTHRSNCVLSDQKIDSLKLKLPSTIDSLSRCLQSLAHKQHLSAV